MVGVVTHFSDLIVLVLGVVLLLLVGPLKCMYLHLECHDDSNQDDCRMETYEYRVSDDPRMVKRIHEVPNNGESP